jgi:hypothetical protein
MSWGVAVQENYWKVVSLRESFHYRQFTGEALAKFLREARG